MNIKEFAKDHKKELIIGGVVIVGLATVIIATKAKKSIPLVTPEVTDHQFAEIAAKMATAWDATPNCLRMDTGACLLQDFDRYAKYIQSQFPDNTDHVIELIIAHSPNNRIMNTAEWFKNNHINLFDLP